MNNQEQLPNDEPEKGSENGSENIDSGNSYNGEVFNETTEHGSGRRRRTKRRVKVKTRIRVKKKTDSKKKYKKLLEQIVWFLFIAGFIVALVILYQQLGINDANYKNNKRTSIDKPFPSSQLAEIQYFSKQKSNSIVMGI
jgi:hypothetical protein